MNQLTVTPKWLKENLNHPDLIILDASKSENGNAQIQGAIAFDIKNKFSDTNSKFPNTLLNEKDFEIACQQIGINQNSIIVVYDNIGIYNSPRVWWMFKTMGFQHIYVLDGGLPLWIYQENPTEKINKPTFKKGNFKAQLDSEKVKDYKFIKSNIKTQGFLIIDARSEGRFNGTAPEPRAGLASGNIPKSINIPFKGVLNENVFKSKKELEIIFDELKNNKLPLVFSCGSGITACIVLMAYQMVLNNEISVYDGSWTEWAILEQL